MTLIRGVCPSIIAIVLAGAGCKWGSSAAKPKTDEKPVQVIVTEVSRGTVRAFLEVSADCEAEAVADVRSRVAGQVVAVHCTEGDMVQADDLLVELDRKDAQLAVRKAAATLDLARLSVEEADAAVKAAGEALRTAEFTRKYAQKEYERVASLMAGEVGAVSEDILEARKHDHDQAMCTERKCGVDLEKMRVAAEVARSKVADAKIALEEAQLSLSYRTIRAPISGQVVVFTLHVGDFVGAREGQVARIESAEHLFVRFDVAQSDIRKVHAGQGVAITSQAFPDSTFRGEVESVNRAVDRTSGTVRVRVRILEPGELLPGLFVVGRIILEERHGVPTVPREAIRYEGKRPYVWYVDGDSTARRRDVTIGLSDDEVVEILSFVSDEDAPETIILRGNVKEGKAVRIDAPGLNPEA